MTKQRKMGFFILTALVIGNMMGSGIFMLPRQMAEVASPLATLLAWIFTGAGVLLIALVFGNLAVKRPDLTSGAQSHAYAFFNRPGAKHVAGFIAVWSYWVANWAGNVSLITSFAGYLSVFFPILNSKTTFVKMGEFTITEGQVLTFAVCTVLLWGIAFIISRGVSGAGKINLVATIAKVGGFFLFIIIAVFSFQSAKMGEFYHPVYNSAGLSEGLLSQVNSAAIVTLWAFIGIESAMMFAGRAKSGKTVRAATITGLIVAVMLYSLISILTLGLIPKENLIGSASPLADALNAVIGSGGSAVMATLALICLFGSAIGWIMMSSEAPHQAAKNGIFLPYLKKTNKNGTPVRSLVLTCIASQFFIFSTLSGDIAVAYDFVVKVSTLAFLVQYFISPIFQLKLVFTGSTYETSKLPKRITDGIIAFLALCYSLWIMKSGTENLTVFLLSIGLFLLGFVLYPLMRKQTLAK
ncbi:putative arginine/ornithine antiporter YvsH [Listeria floridensis FSL S10-1187]|uniref:Arginine/ornithine antiporter YvsH n=1 Tax=Listeria floridensis FSL S10-1187 TaxID=1265817 RepID=A0ABN0RI13_9LIST|nr:amino acid permease [Listeria floridensis]EUJ33559.1 putative arginine/ornithine antiporter YvsH [Listeria floridensis FSL S10-1187]